LRQKTAEIAIAVAGAALVVAPLAATQEWLDRHFLPSFIVSRFWYVAIETSVRVLFGVAGVMLIVVARSIASRATARVVGRAAGVLAAVVLALAASEVALQRTHLRPTEWRILDEEPRRLPDARLGWRFAPNRTAYNTSGGRTIEYAFDAAGYRVRHAGQAIDPDRPSILFAGESVMFGDGLTYDESVPAQVESMLGTQSVNLGVYGFSIDQTYLRVAAELPHFRQPVAVVALFMTALFGRNLDDDRPHLDNGLVWLPAVEHSRLVTLAGLVVPFRRHATVENGIVVTREALRAIVDLARARYAVQLIVVPVAGRESAPERRLRERILDEAHLPYVLMQFDASWHIAGDHHPDARAAQVIARAIAERFRH